MRYCHACQDELDAESLASGRCINCGAAIRTIAQRTLEDKNLLHQPSPGESSEESIDVDVTDTDRSGATLEIPV